MRKADRNAHLYETKGMGFIPGMEGNAAAREVDDGPGQNPNNNHPDIQHQPSSGFDQFERDDASFDAGSLLNSRSPKPNKFARPSVRFQEDPANMISEEIELDTPCLPGRGIDRSVLNG